MARSAPRNRQVRQPNLSGRSPRDRTWSPDTRGRDYLTSRACGTDFSADSFYGDRLIRYYCDVVADDFNEALADDEELVAAVSPNHHLARQHACQQRHVRWIDPDLPFDRRQRDHL